MNVKKVNIHDLFYLEGEATRDDIEVLEVETKENIASDPDEYLYSWIEAKIQIRLREDLRDLLGYNDEKTHRIGPYDNPPGIRILKASARTKSKNESAIKRMRTNIEKECKIQFSQKKIDHEIDCLVNNANWTIKRSRESFVERMSVGFGGDVKWDNEERLDELAEERAQLQSKINEIEKEMKSIMNSETEEWLNENGCNSELVEKILKQVHYGSYLSSVISISGPSRRRKKSYTDLT